MAQLVKFALRIKDLHRIFLKKNLSSFIYSDKYQGLAKVA